MNIVSFSFELLGSLAVFLIGMKIMSEGIQKVAGDQLQHILNYMTKNRFSGVLTGFFGNLFGAVIIGNDSYGCQLCKCRHIIPYSKYWRCYGCK